MQRAPELQRIIDAEHLRLLRLGYFISAAGSAFFALLGVYYAGRAVFLGATAENEPPPESIVWTFLILALGFMLVSGTIAGLKLWAARCLRRRTWHTFCVIMSLLSCLEIPFGTALGVLSLVVLNRLSVKQEFAQSAA